MRLLVFLCFLGTFSATATTQGSKFKFRYQELQDPWESVPCIYQQLPIGLHEYEVQCEIKGKLKVFDVHLLVQFYPKTNYGVGAYEILYWVTNKGAPAMERHDSSSFWIHNSEQNNRVKLFELNQGIENDQAYLRLEISFK